MDITLHGTSYPLPLVPWFTPDLCSLAFITHAKMWMDSQESQRDGHKLPPIPTPRACTIRHWHWPTDLGTMRCGFKSAKVQALTLGPWKPDSNLYNVRFQQILVHHESLLQKALHIKSWLLTYSRTMHWLVLTLKPWGTGSTMQWSMEWWEALTCFCVMSFVQNTADNECMFSNICINSYSASRDNWCTVAGDGGCRVGEVRAGTTSPMPDHKGFKLQ